MSEWHKKSDWKKCDSDHKDDDDCKKDKKKDDCEKDKKKDDCEKDGKTIKANPVATGGSVATGNGSTANSGNLASTWVAKQSGHAEHQSARKSTGTLTNANEDVFAQQPALRAA